MIEQRGAPDEPLDERAKPPDHMSHAAIYSDLALSRTLAILRHHVSQWTISSSDVRTAGRKSVPFV
jgi:hypothetical protein